ncbi:hypothetical protein J3459_006654 [Metarhizium acridum]|nr:hypothetical protein J3459_006654 [Metarhizium acridum]
MHGPKPSDPEMQKTLQCEPSITQVRPHLFIGNLYSSSRPQVLRENNITAIISLFHGRYGKWGAPSIRSIVPEANHLYIPCLDSTTMDLLAFMSNACDFIDKQDGNVLVHCLAGVSRSASIAIAYLMRKHHLGLDQVLAEVKEKRKVKPNSNFINQLRVWEAVGYQVWQDSDGKIPKEAYQSFLDQRLSLLKAKGLTGDEPIEIQSL